MKKTYVFFSLLTLPSLVFCSDVPDHSQDLPPASPPISRIIGLGLPKRNCPGAPERPRRELNRDTLKPENLTKNFDNQKNNQENK